MFTKADYATYIEQMSQIERSMVYRCNDLVARLHPESIHLREALQAIVRDEVRHYSLLMELFDPLLLEGERDRRRFKRDHFLGQLQLRIERTGETVSGYCVNVSDGGMCAELERRLPPGEFVAVSVEYFDGRPHAHYRGEIIWSEERSRVLSGGEPLHQTGVRLTLGDSTA